MEAQTTVALRKNFSGQFFQSCGEETKQLELNTCSSTGHKPVCETSPLEGPKELVRAPSPAVRPAEPELAVKFVPNFTSQQILVDSKKAWPKCDITLVAYSFDRKKVVEALEGHQGRTRLLADLSQTNGKTKQQYQVLLRLQRAGCSIRVGSGTSVRSAYLSDQREISAMRLMVYLRHGAVTRSVGA